MKFTFNFVSMLPALALLALASGCSRPGDRPPPAPDGGEAQRLVSVLDYVGGDYGLAVRAGVVVSAAEYEEQVRFVADARRLAGSLLGPAGATDDPLLRRLVELAVQVERRADAEDVAASCRAAREDVVARFGLKTMPAERPSLARAESLYAGSCAQCHGTRGDAQTERAKQLDPPPASFRDPERLHDLSPYRVYNALTFGVPGTAMASFDLLAPADRWSLAFYVFRLGHEGRPERGPVAATLADLAARSDAEIVAALRAESHPDPDAGLAFARREAAYHERPTGVGIDQTRRLLRHAATAFAQGRRAEADALALDAYLQGFEPLEPRLRARDPQGVLAVESGFRELRAALARTEAGEVRARAQVLDARLSQLLSGSRPVLPSIAAFLIYFREGIEAALLVAALLAALRKLGRPDAGRFVHLGWLAALPAGVATWWAVDHVVTLAAHQRELVEAVVALMAAAVLFSVSFWMISRAESKHWMGYLKRGVEQSLSRRNLLLLAGLSFLAVYREAAETVLFTQALLLEADTQRLHVWMGAAAGLLAVVVVALLMSRTVSRLPLRPFFAVSGALLCALAISFAGSGIYDLVAAGYLPPRPVAFPEIPWMGIHPDLTGLLVQLAIVGVIAGAAFSTFRRRPAAASRER